MREISPNQVTLYVCRQRLETKNRIRLDTLHTLTLRPFKEQRNFRETVTQLFAGVTQ
jgi:hypothetical protein